MRHQRFTRSAGFTVMGVAGVLAIAGPAAAQERDVVFAHGLNQNGTAWNVMRPQLESALQISALAPNLFSYSTYETQASNLHNALAGRNSVVAITHSNGGVVTRQYLTRTDLVPRVNAHISLGSPHAGAPLAEKVITGEMMNWAVEIYNSIATTFHYYYENDPNFSSIAGLSPGAAQTIQLTLGYIDLAVAGLGYVPPFLNMPQALPQMVPGSAFLTNVNGRTARLIEAERASYRVGISTQMPSGGQPYSLLFSDPTALEATVLSLAGFALAMGEHYSGHGSQQLANNAYRWYVLADVLLTIPPTWFWMQGSLVEFNPFTYQYWVLHNDGVVPWDRSGYPGGVSEYMPAATYGSIPHGEQQSKTAIRDYVSQHLTSGLGIALRSGGSGPPENPITISGPSVVAPGSSCTFVGGSAIGTFPYTFEWYFDGVFMGVGESMAFNFASAGALISVVVYDADGLLGSGGLQVNVSPGTPPCYVQ